MPLTQEQSAEIKKQLLKQVEQLPQENKEEIKKYIQELNPSQLEEFLKQNKIQISEQGLSQEQKSEKPIFQSIVDGEIPSYKIDENKKAVAILEINPLSKGHSIVLPKKQVPTEKIPKSAMSLAQKIAKKIKSKLKPEDIKIETSNFQNYPMINIIPIYKDVKLEKKKVSEKELIEMQVRLEVKKRGSRKSSINSKKQMSKSQEKKSNIPEISFRIPD